MSSLFFVPCLILSLLLLINPTTAKTAQKPSQVGALVFPVTKDPSTSQYITTIFQRTPLRAVKVTVDIGGKALWVACDKEEYASSTYRPALCRSPQCKIAKSKSCGDCLINGPSPGCNNNTCSNVVYNTVEKSAMIGEVASDVLVLQSTDGSNLGPIVKVPNFVFSCGSLFLGDDLARGVKGIAGFGRTATSLPSLLSTSLGIHKKFAICLSSSKGVAFLGNGPYIFLPRLTISDRLIYTPLLINPVTTLDTILNDFPDKSWPSMEYFIGVNYIKINGKTVAISPDLLKISKKGNGGTKISTVAPYTVLHTSIYNAVTKAYTKATSKVQRVSPVPPFGTCYKASALGSSRLGPAVPPIELVLQNNVTWTIFGGNSMVYVNKSEVACMAFVDGGNAQTSIVIGGHQLEDNLLEFDVEKSRLGFSSTLLGRQTTCSNFNFTKNG